MTFVRLNLSRLRLPGILFVAGVALTACAPTNWTKPGATQQDLATDTYVCERDMRQSGYFGDDIFTGFRMENFDNKCMIAHGWRVAGSTSAQPDPKVVQFREAVAERKSCVRSVADSPVYGPLMPYFGDVDTGRFSMAQLANDRVPTPAESALFIRYFDEASLCVDRFNATASQLAPALGPILVQQKMDTEALALQIVKRQIGWGEASRKQQDINNLAAAKVRDVRS